MITDVVELHFIDGPLAGMRKMVYKDDITVNRTYRHLEPSRLHSEQRAPTNTNISYVQITASEWHYVPIPLPNRSGNSRFAMLLESGI